MLGQMKHVVRLNQVRVVLHLMVRVARAVSAEKVFELLRDAVHSPPRVVVELLRVWWVV